MKKIILPAALAALLSGCVQSEFTRSYYHSGMVRYGQGQTITSNYSGGFTDVQRGPPAVAIYHDGQGTAFALENRGAPPPPPADYYFSTGSPPGPQLRSWDYQPCRPQLWRSGSTYYYHEPCR